LKIAIISKDENAKSIKYLLENIPDRNDIFLVAPNAEKSVYNINKINDKEMLDFDSVKKYFHKYFFFEDRIGWYYQQFLKYKVVLKLKDNDVFIIDGDTILENDIIQQNLLCYTGKQKYQQYDNFYKILFPEHKLSRLSFITNQMFFKKEYLISLIEEIEKKYNKNWIEAIIYTITNNNNTSFSEYQTYAEYIINNKYKYELKKIKIFRRMDLIEDLTDIGNALNYYDILSYEYHHESSLSLKIRMYIYYLTKRNVG